MRLIIKLSGLAIGLVSIFAAKIWFIEIKDRSIDLINSKPIQFKIEKNKSQISQDFYPKFDGEYFLAFVPLSLVGSGISPNIAPPSVKTKVTRDDRNVNVIEEGEISCNSFNFCRVASFRSIANRKHTILIDIKNIDSRWYAFKPIIQAGASSDAYRIESEMKMDYLAIFGISISICSIIILAIDPIIKKYKQNR